MTDDVHRHFSLDHVDRSGLNYLLPSTSFFGSTAPRLQCWGGYLAAIADEVLRVPYGNTVHERLCSSCI